MYNFVRPDTTTIEGEEIENIIYISRQTIRFTRCMYFFLWFQHSFIQFSTSNPDVIISRSRARELEKHLSSSRLISPFVSPAICPVGLDEAISDIDGEDRDGDEVDDDKDVDGEREAMLPGLIHIRKFDFNSEERAEVESPWWKQADELAEGEDERCFLRGAMGTI